MAAVIEEVSKKRVIPLLEETPEFRGNFQTLRLGYAGHVRWEWLTGGQACPSEDALSLTKNPT